MAIWTTIAGGAQRAGRAVSEGVRSTAVKVNHAVRKRPYQYEPPVASVILSQRAQSERLRAQDAPADVFAATRDLPASAKAPFFSVLLPAGDIGPDRFEESLISVLSQTWSLLELIVADTSVQDDLREVLEDYDDERIHYLRQDKDRGPSVNLNLAAMQARGDYVVILEGGDLLTPDALFETAMVIMEKKPEVLYSDEDFCDQRRLRFHTPYYKPDFNKDYLFARDYIRHMLVIRRELLQAMRFRSRFDGAQEYDLVLRAPKSSICHVGKVLYHTRDLARKTPAGAKAYDEASRAALEEYFRSRGVSAKVRSARLPGNVIEYSPDIFSARSEVGVIGGRVVDRRHRIVGGLMKKDGTVYFAGMDETETGDMYEACTVRNAEAVDARCMKIRPELNRLYQEIFGHDYEEGRGRDTIDILEKSLLFCRRVRSMGYLIVWDPSMRGVLPPFRIRRKQEKEI